MGVDLTKLVPEMQAKAKAFVAACWDDPALKSQAYVVVITEARRLDIDQARYFCHGRTPAEILAWLDHVQAEQTQRDMLSLAMQEFFGAAWAEHLDVRATGRIITTALPFTGPHCLGVAFHARVKHGERVLPDQETPWETLGKISRRTGLVWGGDWRMRDLEHHELPKPWPNSDVGAHRDAPIGKGGSQTAPTKEAA